MRPVLAAFCILGAAAVLAADDPALGELRSWLSTADGTALRARCVGLRDNLVILRTEDGGEHRLRKGALTPEDQEHIAALPFLSTADWLTADWSGLSTAERVRHHAVRIAVSGGKLSAQNVVFQALTLKQARQAQPLAGGRTEAGDRDDWRYLARETCEVAVDGSNVTIKVVRATVAGAPAASSKTAPLANYSGVFLKPGLLIGAWTNQAGAGGHFWWARQDAFYRLEPGPIAPGCAAQLTPLDGTPCRYRCRLPAAYDPSQPAPVMIVDAPDGNPPLLAPQVADELGWIMVGLSGVPDGTPPAADARITAAVVFDLRRRFRIDPARFYFAGLAGGGRRAADRGVLFPDACAGLLCIASAFNFTSAGTYRLPPLNQATAFIVGENDLFAGGEVVHRAVPDAQAKGRPVRLFTHPGGQEWGPVELQEAALRWLGGVKSGGRPIQGAAGPAVPSRSKLPVSTLPPPGPPQ